MLSFVTASPITVCGRSGRWSLLLPYRRNESSSSVSKYALVVSNSSTSISRLSRLATANCHWAIACMTWSVTRDTRSFEAESP